MLAAMLVAHHQLKAYSGLALDQHLRQGTAHRALATANGTSLSVAEPPRKKLIKVGGDIPDTAFLRQQGSFLG
jgi:hypothetical protein